LLIAIGTSVRIDRQRHRHVHVTKAPHEHPRVDFQIHQQRCGWTETVWFGAGSGCSLYNTALAAASSANTGCAKRAMADVSAVADPNTGVAVYDSTAYKGSSGWMVFGGTSASAPIIGSVYALSGNTTGYANALPYAHTSALFDVTSGSNGTCPTTQWCTARAGWDGPSGLGTPNGVSAF